VWGVGGWVGVCVCVGRCVCVCACVGVYVGVGVCKMVNIGQQTTYYTLRKECIKITYRLLSYSHKKALHSIILTHTQH